MRLEDIRKQHQWKSSRLHTYSMQQEFNNSFSKLLWHAGLVTVQKCCSVTLLWYNFEVLTRTLHEYFHFLHYIFCQRKDWNNLIVMTQWNKILDLKPYRCSWWTKFSEIMMQVKVSNSQIKQNKQWWKELVQKTSRQTVQRGGHGLKNWADRIKTKSLRHSDVENLTARHWVGRNVQAYTLGG